MKNKLAFEAERNPGSVGLEPANSAEVQTILRHRERDFRTFIFVCALVCLLVLLAMRAAAASEEATNTLRLNFHGARLDQVLDYLSDAAGFVIEKQTEVQGTVEMWSKEPVTRGEAVRLLNAALRKNGWAVIRNGRILTIVSADRAKTSDLEIVTGRDPNQVEKSDETVTQLIPVRYAGASQLLNNLQGLLPSSATLSANEDANTLILVATKADIRRMLKIINALDSALATASSIQVISLRHADAKELAALLPQIFSSTGSQSGSGQSSRGQNFDMPGGPGGFGQPGMPGGPDTATGSGSAGTASSSPKVVAVADERSNALIVSAPADLLPFISNVVRQLDQPATDNTELRVFHLVNADATETASQLAALFPDTSGSDSGQNQDIAIFGGPPAPPGALPDGTAATGNSSAGGSRKLKQSRVLTVADPRTSSLIVSAGSGLMPQVAALVTQLDSISARNEVVKVWELRNADPQDVNQVLQALFNRNGTTRNNDNNANTLLGQNNPLTARQTQQQSSANTSSGFGTASTGQAGGAPNSAGGGF